MSRSSNKRYEHLIGKRVEIPPYCDLWMRGAMYGAIVRMYTGTDGRLKAKVRMDHPQVRGLVTAVLDELKIL